MPTIANADLPGHCIFAGFLSNVPVFADACGTIFRLDGALKGTDVHQGLACAAETLDRAALLTGGEDGKVASINANGIHTIISETPRKWITSIAAGPASTIAYSTGKITTVIDGASKRSDQSHERSIEGVALAPKGTRLARGS